MEVVHELDEPDQICPSCGGDLDPTAGQFEEADEVEVVERSFRIVRHQRQKYRCRCGERIEMALGPEERLAVLAALRAKESKPVIDEIRTWLMTQRALPRSTLGKAIAYTSGLWPGLVRLLGDPKIPLDTNGVEPRAYLREATLQAVRNPGTATLPRDLK